jgi:hypothetical protein
MSRRRAVYTTLLISQLLLYSLVSFITFDPQWIAAAGVASAKERLGGLILWTLASGVTSVIVYHTLRALGYYEE